MKHYVLIAAAVMIGASSVIAAPGTIIKAGQCTLLEAGAFDKTKVFAVELKNTDIQIKFNLRGDKFFGKFVIQTTPSISNLTAQSKHLAYNIAFFDKNAKLIACTSSSTDLDPNEKNKRSGSNMPEIPRSDLETIASYQAVVYVTDVNPK